jgi:hypothetical protein
MLSSLTTDQWTAVGAISAAIGVLVALGAWFRPRPAKDTAFPIKHQDAVLKVSGLRILELNGKSRIAKVLPGQTYAIGRSKDNDIVLSDEDDTVSRHHAKIEVHETFVKVIDQGATNPMVFADDSSGQEYKLAEVKINQAFLLGGAKIIVIA